jgi:hypothetical protein
MEQSISELLNLSETELFQQLGHLLVNTEQQVGSATTLTAARAAGPAPDTASLAGTTDFLERVAKRFLTRFNFQLYSLICNPDDPDNPTIRAAFGGGMQSLGLVLGGVLVAHFAWLPAIAVVIAAILAKRVIKGGHEAVCGEWGEQFKK